MQARESRAAARPPRLRIRLERGNRRRLPRQGGRSPRPFDIRLSGAELRFSARQIRGAIFRSFCEQGFWAFWRKAHALRWLPSVWQQARARRLPHGRWRASAEEFSGGGKHFGGGHSHGGGGHSGGHGGGKHRRRRTRSRSRSDAQALVAAPRCFVSAATSPPNQLSLRAFYPGTGLASPNEPLGPLTFFRRYLISKRRTC